MSFKKLLSLQLAFGASLILTLMTAPLAGHCLNSKVEQTGGLIGRWANGPCYSVAARGDTAYFGNGAFLQIVDFSVPAAPVELGRLLLPAPIGDICLVGNYAYINSDGLRIVDISDPAHPFEANAYSSIAAYDFAISGNYAYISSAGGMFRVFDITSPASPVEVGDYDVGFGSGNELTVEGSYVYMVLYGWLRVIDVTNPASPTEAGFYSCLDCNFRDVVAKGDYVYAAAYYDGIKVINVADPANPVLSRTFDTNGRVRGLDLSGDFLYVADHDQGVLRINISNPSYPVGAGFYDTAGLSAGAAAGGSCIFVADEQNGLRVMTSLNSFTIIESGFFETGGAAKDADVAGSYAYLASDWKGLRVLNIADPMNPVEVGFYDTDSNALKVAVSGNYAYVADDEDGLRIVDITNPASPVEAGSYEPLTPGSSTRNVVVDGNYAYLAADYGGFRIVDISVPGSPSEVGAYIPVNEEVYDIAIAGNYACLGTHVAGLMIVDITNPASPVELGSYDTIFAYGVAVSGNYAYVAAYQMGLRVIDITNPASPVEVGFYDTDGLGGVRDLVVSGNYAYLAETIDGLRIVDVSSPANPIEVGYFNTGASAINVEVTAGDNIFVADGNDGLYILSTAQVPALVQSYAAILKNGFVHVKWTLSNSVSATDLSIYRKEHPVGIYQKIENARIEGGESSFEFVDQKIEPGKIYSYRVELSQSSGGQLLFETEPVETPSLSLSLLQNYPNPFNPNTTISFVVPERMAVSLVVYNLKGELVSNLIDRSIASGYTEVVWDGTDSRGNPVSSGIYFYRLKAGNKTLTKKMVLLK